MTLNSLSKTLNWHAASHPDFPALDDEQVHLWWLPLEINRAQSSTTLDWLSDIQRDKYFRRSETGLQDSYLAGRYFLLTLLGAYIKEAPEDVLLSYSRLNKPYLSHHERNIEFNFTDTIVNGKAYGLYAFSKNHEVGVDIEALSRRSNFAAVAQRRFTEQELSIAGEPFDDERFLALWTRKEAFGKATGQGINFKMNRRNLVNGETSDYAFFDDEQKPWQLCQFQPSPEFVAALVYGADQSLEIKSFNALNHIP